MRAFVILVTSSVLTALYAYARPVIMYNDGDPLTYLRKAWLFIGHAGGADVPSRGPGYPLWLIITGAAPFDWWWSLVASHLVMAALMSVLVYAIVSPYARNGAVVAAFAFMATGLPWVYLNWMMTEHLFMFVELVALVMLSRMLRKTELQPV